MERDKSAPPAPSRARASRTFPECMLNTFLNIFPVPFQKAHPYQFDYAVKDESQALDFSREESQDAEGKVTGEYRVLLPDGRTQVVTYTADHLHGYQAIVRYEGEARVEPSYSKPTYPAPGTSYSAAPPTVYEPEPTIAAVPTTAAPEVTTAAPEPTYSAPQPSAPRRQYPAAPQSGYLPPQRYGGRPATRYGAPTARPQHSYLPPPAHQPIYFASQPTEAPLAAVAAVVAETQEDAPAAAVPAGTSTTPGLGHGELLPQVAVDPIPEVTEVTQQQVEVRYVPGEQAQTEAVQRSSAAEAGMMY